MPGHTFGRLAVVRRYAAQHGMTVRKVTCSKRNIYYRILRDGVVIGFFNENVSKDKDGRKDRKGNGNGIGFVSKYAPRIR